VQGLFPALFGLYLIPVFFFQLVDDNGERIGCHINEKGPDVPDPFSSIYERFILQ
jgi:hypothetical protein